MRGIEIEPDMLSSQSTDATGESGDFPRADGTPTPHLTPSTTNSYSPQGPLDRQIRPQRKTPTLPAVGSHQEGVESQELSSATRTRTAPRAVDAWKAECDRHAARVRDPSYSAPSAEHLAVREVSWKKAVAARRATRQAQRDTARDNQNDTTKPNLGNSQQTDPAFTFPSHSDPAGKRNTPYRASPIFPFKTVAPKPEASSKLGGVSRQDQSEAATFLQPGQQHNHTENHETFQQQQSAPADIVSVDTANGMLNAIIQRHQQQD
ncbi:hypothetical protein QBC40DRAFT_252958 [Triangularia verruculosa]|uniref:Uncharacterized protein n=1 Tax=Triangularia verruculosa TaxID=2587418 RepID=A0AAN6XJL3_9PEZI|nr:hypothetical protein QBC40DRAFT_252958 [Triangularia verruculosa]